MSDTANPANLASAAEFDARLKRTDEDRWLATRYAPPEGRELLAAIYLLNQELQRTLHTKEPMLGKIRLQWWRETLEQVAGPGPVRRHDLAEELARLTATRKDLLAPMNALIDAFDDILDDHMRAGGHQSSDAHEQRHLAVEAALMRLAGQALNARTSAGHLEVLGRLGEARLAVVADLSDSAKRWNAVRAEARTVPSGLWPAILHLAPRPADGPFLRRWRMFTAALTRHLGPLSAERDFDV